MPSFSFARGEGFFLFPGTGLSFQRRIAPQTKDQMPKSCLVSLAIASACVSNVFANFADTVVNYATGTGFSAGYIDPNSALGEPSRVTAGPFGGPVDPFSPPYLAEQLVSLGAGGSLTLGFSAPILNSPAHPFALDFIIFGSSGFIITNGDFSGGGVTDGSLFAANTGSTKVSVSADGLNYFELTPSLAPVVDSYFPTDGSGNFSLPVNPALNRGSFADKDLAAIRELYSGSAGGTGFDISWARDSSGQPADLASVRYVRIDVLSGTAEIDGVSAVPEPSVVSMILAGGGLFLFFRRRA
ncbi:MAG TPA: PEP-CTERM sorting domain-containing protein [Verrucomicrobiae bacterium]|nr:PEP-CTERM sorting domain-containing protein [Verrucomicrobiae bacterium]